MTSDKETILTAYLNHLPYGNQFTGARAAARGYFGKPLGDLSLAESALLAGLPNKPTKLNPWKNLDGARQRQLWILGRMREEGYIDEARFAAALIEEPRLIAGHERCNALQIHDIHIDAFHILLKRGRQPGAIGFFD